MPGANLPIDQIPQRTFREILVNASKAGKSRRTVGKLRNCLHRLHVVSRMHCLGTPGEDGAAAEVRHPRASSNRDPSLVAAQRKAS